MDEIRKVSRDAAAGEALYDPAQEDVAATPLDEIRDRELRDYSCAATPQEIGGWRNGWACAVRNIAPGAACEKDGVVKTAKHPEDREPSALEAARDKALANIHHHYKNDRKFVHGWRAGWDAFEAASNELAAERARKFNPGAYDYGYAVGAGNYQERIEKAIKWLEWMLRGYSKANVIHKECTGVIDLLRGDAAQEEPPGAAVDETPPPHSPVPSAEARPPGTPRSDAEGLSGRIMAESVRVDGKFVGVDERHQHLAVDFEAFRAETRDRFRKLERLLRVLSPAEDARRNALLDKQAKHEHDGGPDLTAGEASELRLMNEQVAKQPTGDPDEDRAGRIIQAAAQAVIDGVITSPEYEKVKTRLTGIEACHDGHQSALDSFNRRLDSLKREQGRQNADLQGCIEAIDLKLGWESGPPPPGWALPSDVQSELHRLSSNAAKDRDRIDANERHWENCVNQLDERDGKIPKKGWHQPAPEPFPGGTAKGETPPPFTTAPPGPGVQGRPHPETKPTDLPAETRASVERIDRHLRESGPPAQEGDPD